MKKYLLPIFLFGALGSFAQAPAIQWQKSLGGSSTDKGNAIQQTADGGYIVAGETNSSDGDVTVNNGTTDYWVARLDGTGTLVWQKSLGGSNDDRANTVIQCADGGYLVAGASNSTQGDITASKGMYDFWVVKLNATGAITWQKSLGGTSIEEARAVQQTSDGGYIIAGEARSNNSDLTGNYGISDFWVVKLDGTGTLVWQKNLGGTGTDIAHSVQQTSDGGYIVAGQSNSSNNDVTGNNGGVDMWVCKLTSTGALTWQKSLGGTGTEVAYSVKQTSDGGYILAGKTDSNNNGNVTGNNGFENVWVVKLTSTGTISWQDCFGGSMGFDNGYSIAQTADGGYVFGGAASSNDVDVSGNQGSNDFWVVKLNSTGGLSWQKCLGGSSSDVATSIQQTADNGYVVAGRAASAAGDITSPKGLDDFWVVKLAGSGTTTPTGIREESGNTLFSAYPNPNHGVLTIGSQQLPEGSSIQILNAAGQVVYRSEMKGTTLQADLSALENKGVYLLQATDANGTVLGVKKLIVD